MNLFSFRFCTFALLAAAGAALAGCNGASDMALNEMNAGTQSRGFTIQTLARSGRVRPYGLFVPQVPAEANGYPVIVFLHGLGEGGSDSRGNMRVGLAPFVAQEESTFKFICIFPQSDNGQWDPNSANADDVIAELDAVSKMYPVDRDRVSLTGLSTGGYGTWAIGAKYHDRFAALVPMASAANPNAFAGQLLDMPVRSYHNVSDPFAAVWNDSSMVDTIRASGGTQCSFNATMGLGHDCWDDVYRNGDLFTWLENQRRPGAVGRGVVPQSAAIPVNTPLSPASKTPAPPSASPVQAAHPAAKGPPPPVAYPSPSVVEPSASVRAGEPVFNTPW